MADERRQETPEETGGPTIEQQDWDALKGGEVAPESVPDNGDLRYAPETGDGELPGEDDDNPYQDSDEALPDDKEEAALRRDPSKEKTSFDEV